MTQRAGWGLAILAALAAGLAAALWMPERRLDQPAPPDRLLDPPRSGLAAGPLGPPAATNELSLAGPAAPATRHAKAPRPVARAAPARSQDPPPSPPSAPDPSPDPPPAPPLRPVSSEWREPGPPPRRPSLASRTDATAPSVGDAEAVSDAEARERRPPPGPWPCPAALVGQLEGLAAQGDPTGAIASALDALARLQKAPRLDSPEAAEPLETLADAARRLQAEGAALLPGPRRTWLLQASYAITRRTALWTAVRQAALARGTTLAAGVPDRPTAAVATVRQVRRLLETSPRGSPWADFLKLSELQRLALGGVDAQQRRNTARTVLERITSPRLDAAQRAFVARPELAELEGILRRWAAGPVALDQLLADVEMFESGSPAEREEAARRLGEAFQRLRWRTDAPAAAVAAQLQTHYRNANFRVAVSEQLLNRVLPALDEIEEPVLDEILGARVVGRSRTAAQLHLSLIPDPRRWRVGVQARGRVDTLTSSRRGPVTFFNRGVSPFRARKVMVFDIAGFRSQRTEAEADPQADLTGLETMFDGVPLLGWLVRTIALRQHEALRDDVRWEMKGKLERRVRSKVDQEVAQQVAAVRENFRDRVVRPLSRLRLHPSALELQTTQTRLIARCRLADANQLAAYTPRPQAPGDSLLSVQIHESLLNNTVDRLPLAGRRADLRDLYRDLAAALGWPNAAVPEDFPEHVTVALADQAPVRLACRDGRAWLTLRLAELSRPGEGCWRNFVVRVRYRPDESTAAASLVRDGVIQLQGERLRLRDQIILRGVFSKVFSRNQPIPIITRSLVERLRMDDVAVTQFVIDDGWIGVALGPPDRPRDRWAKARVSIGDQSEIR